MSKIKLSKIQEGVLPAEHIAREFANHLSDIYEVCIEASQDFCDENYDPPTELIEQALVLLYFINPNLFWMIVAGTKPAEERIESARTAVDEISFALRLDGKVGITTAKDAYGITIY